MNERAKIIFNQVYKGQTNFITPEILDYFDLGNGLYAELSQGEAENHSMLYSVMVVQVDGKEYIKRDDLHRLFKNHKEAVKYIVQLQKGSGENAERSD
jgi:hypothetical protein